MEGLTCSESSEVTEAMILCILETREPVSSSPHLPTEEVGRECLWMLAPEIMGWGEGGWLKAEGLRSTLGRETEKKEKPQQGGCYRAGDKTGNWEAGRRVRVTYLW